jgi:hypothetical protein
MGYNPPPHSDMPPQIGVNKWAIDINATKYCQKNPE